LPHASATADRVAGTKFTGNELQLLGQGIIEYYKNSKLLLEKLSKAYNFKYLCFWQPVIFIEKKVTDEEASCDIRNCDEALGKLYRYVNDRLSETSISHFFNISDAVSVRTKTFI